MWVRHHNWKWTNVAWLLADFLFLLNPPRFLSAGAYAVMILFNMGLKRAIRDKYTWVLAVLTLLPYAAFHIYGVYITGLLTSQFSLRFFPQLLLQPAFYLQWVGQINGTMGLIFFLTAIVAILLLPEKTHRAMWIGIILGYFIYGMTFTHHITTHDYYQLPLIPLVAAGVGIAFSALLMQLQGPRWLSRIIILFVMLFWIGIQSWDVRVTLKRDDYRHEAVIWQELGAELGTGASTVGLLHDYGYRLAYWGWVTPTNWFTSGDMRYRELAGQTFDFDTLFAETTAGKQFFVITLFGEYESQPELKSKLEHNYPVIEQSGDYIIFDLQHPIQGEQP